VVENGKLAIVKTANAETPLTRAGATPLLTIDVWEHAYYLDYQNRRADYVTAWWNVVNWPAVSKRFAA
jgi:Fe-Mn family superoxide dismutase